LAALPTNAQDAENSRNYADYSFGLNLSNVSGLGLSYRIFIGDKAGVQLTGGIIATTSQTSYSGGFELQYALSRTPNYRVFVGPAFGVYGSSADKDIPSSQAQSDFNAGLGLGLEVPILGSSVRNQLVGSLTIYYPTFYTSEGTISFGIGAGVHYNF